MLAVQSYCFRGFKDNAQVAAMVKKIGLSNLEICGVHFDINVPSSCEAAIKTYKDAGIGLVSVGVEGLTTDEAAARKRFDLCRKAGAKVMSVSFKPDDMPASWRLAEKLADEFDINLGIHNHGGYDWLGNTTMLAYVFRNTSKRIGLCLDTAWALAAGEDPLKFVELAGGQGRLHSLHVKDFIFGRDRKPQDVVIGTGNLDLSRLAAALKKVGFAGPLILEYEGDVNDPTPALAQCVTAMKSAW